MNQTFRQSLLVAAAVIGMSGAVLAATPDPVVDAKPAVATVSSATGVAAKDDEHNLTARVEQRIVDLHAKLQITAAQQPQWDRFTGVMRANARHMVQGFDARVVMLPTMTATESMQSYAKMAADHADDMQQLVPAFSALYLTMSDDQKHTTDAVFLNEAHGGDPKQAG